jgi:tRNA threonylcarbamoyladenosine biosynthesis protein TsaE
MVSRHLQLVTHCLEETQNLGTLIGKKVRQPIIIALTGDLGSGKTAFVQGLARGLEVPDDYYITSPTFTLINEYPGRCPLVHVDLYRLESIGELEDIGLSERLYDQAVIAIEWADKLPGNLLNDHLAMTIEILDDESRQLDLIAYGNNGVNLIIAVENHF